MRVLIVEDDPEMGRLIERGLRAEGYDTVAVDNGVDALIAVAREEFALAAIDVMLPRMSGFEICRRIRESGSTMPVPLKNGEGGFIASDEELKRLEGEGQVTFRYLGVNPNGSLNDIAGISNARGNVVGLMPHPEHATEEGFGPDTAAAMRNGTDGLVFFTSVIHALASV